MWAYCGYVEAWAALADNGRADPADNVAAQTCLEFWLVRLRQLIVDPSEDPVVLEQAVWGRHLHLQHLLARHR